MEHLNRDKITMPTKELNIYWLDDDSSRFDAFKTLIEDSAADFSLDVKVHPILVDQSLIQTIDQWEQSPPTPSPDLFMLDHVLLPQLPHKLTGNTLAHLLRITFNNIPLVSVTAMFTPGHNHSGQDVHEYTAIIEYNNLSENIESLFSIARDYRQLSAATWEYLMGKLGTPESEQKVLKLAIPQDLVHELTPTKHNQLARWIRSELLEKPGYLFNELHAATFLGLSVAGFSKIKYKFDSALYQGPFATIKRPLWWQTKLREQLYNLVGSDSSDFTQTAGRMLSSFEEADLCKCYVSNTSEAVDFVIAQTYPTKSWHTVREQYTIPNPDSFSPLPGFDQLLIIN
jgi:hypothetical protein